MARLETGTLARELEVLERQHQRRQRRKVEALPDPRHPERVSVDGRVLLNFCSNDYLGLRSHPDLISAASECMQRYGVGAGAAHLVSGHSLEHSSLEAELAEFVERPRALLFSSGYLANLGVISVLAGRHQLIAADRLNHASLIDAAQLAGARLRRYAHADAAACARLLDEHGGARLIVTDGVFSMDGDIAPLASLARAAHAGGAWLVVDDAHGIGVLGAHGRGALEIAGLDTAAVPVLVGTLGKALGCFGAFVAGDTALIETLIQRARTYIYTTAIPPAIAAATRAALRLVQREPWRRQQLQRLVDRFRAGAAVRGLPLASSPTPIQPVIVGDSARALALSEALLQRGFWISAIRPPTVPRGSARLRITLSAAHDEAQVDALLAALGEVFALESDHVG
jgi:8-amino-7-oxononanoate synthase